MTNRSPSAPLYEWPSIADIMPLVRRKEHRRAFEQMMGMGVLVRPRPSTSSQERRRTAKAVSSLELVNSNHLSILRSAFRALRGRFPEPFRHARWVIGDNCDLEWSYTSKTGYRTARGVSPANTDLPAEYHELASARHPEAVRAYRLIEIAHDIRWLASNALPGKARALPLMLPLDQRQAILGLVRAVDAFATYAAEWSQFQHEQARREASKEWRSSAFRKVAKLNEVRAEASRVWRELATKYAVKLAKSKDHLSAYALSQEVCKQLGRHLGAAAPSANTVYQFLRQEPLFAPRRRKRL